MLAALACWLLVRGRCSSGSDAVSRAPGEVQPLREVRRAAAAGVDPAKLWSLYGQRNVARRRIAGRVSFEGRPFAGARVSLQWMGMEAGVAVPPGVVSDASGRFDLGAWFAERFVVTAAAEGKTAAVVEVDLRDPVAAPPPDQLELVLTRCEHMLVGTVVDGSGGPIAGASVGQAHAAAVATASDGSYALCLAMGRQRVWVTADGYGGVVLSVDLRGRVRRDVALVPAGAIHGVVIRKRDGSPVEGALVSAWPVAPGPDHAAEALARSDAGGRFQIGGLAPGRFTVWASTGQLLGSAVVAVMPTRAAEITVALSDRARLDGRVMASGKPVAGARVFASAIGASTGSRTGVSQLDGSFALEEVPLGKVKISAPPYEVIAPAVVEVDRPEVSGVVIEVAPMASIGGRVTRGGQPVVGATVQATAGDVQTVSGAGGRYELRGLRPGTYTVHAEADGSASPPEAVAVKAGEQRADVDLELASRGRIAGTLVDQDGGPVREAIVAWTAQAGDSRRGVSDELGRFVVDELRDGSYRPSVRAAEAGRPLALIGAAPEVVLDAARPKVDGVQLAVRVERLAIAGRVIDDTGAAVPDARVDAIAAPRDGAAVFQSWLRLPHTVSSVDGTFTLDGLAAGSYAVRARGADDREAIASPVDAGARDVVLRLHALAAIDVRLIGFAGTPAVEAENARGDFQKYPGVVAGDRARITGLPAGRYLVTAHTAEELDAAPVVVADGALAEVALTSHGSGRLVATVREFTTGAPVADMRCLVYPTAGGQIGGDPAWDYDVAPATDAQGQVVIDPAPAGQSAVYCYNPPAGMSAARAFVTLGRGERATAQLFTVHLQPPGAGDIGMELDQGFPLTVTSVRDDGPAAVAGIRAGDAIVALGGRAIDQLAKGGVLYWIRSQPIGAAIGITVRRGAEIRTVRVVVGPSLASP